MTFQHDNKKKLSHLWKAATSWGKSVICIFLATKEPMRPPTPTHAPICISVATSGPKYPRVAAIPPVTPILKKKMNELS